MRTRYGTSPWVDQFPASRRPDYPRLRGSHETQVVVVGGGLTGCATAYACAAAGIKTVVIDAERIGQGTVSRGVGLLLPEPGPAFRDIEQLHGLRAARTAFRTWRRASLDGAALLKRLNVKCGLEPLSAVTVATLDDEKNLRREYDSRTKAGLDAAWLSPKQLQQSAVPFGPGALRLADAFGVDPYRACLGLASAAVSRGSAIFERSRMKSVKVRRRGVEVIAETGTIEAQTVVITTGTATPEFRPLRRHFKHRERYLVLTEPMPAGMRKQLGDREVTFTNTRTPPHCVRWTSDDRIVIAGAEQDETPSRSRPAVLVQRTGQLMYELLTMFPMISGLMPEYGWEAVIGHTADGLPFIGSHRNYPNHLFALGGAESVTGAFLASRILLRALRDDSDKDDDVWGFTR